MRKSVLFGLFGLMVVLASCKSKESAYKQAYEKAKAQENTEQVQVNAPVPVTPVATAPATENYDHTPVRQEQVSAVSVSGTLKPYSVVCGSFSLQANAQGLKDYLVGQGYKAGIVKNVEKNMFRVIIGSYDTKAEAARARESFKQKYPSRTDFQGSWILLNK
jgi:cell division protein FtsN